MKGKIIKILTEVLAILVVCLISFVGIYKQNTNRMENKVKDYSLDKNLSGYRELIFEVDSEENETDSLNIENYKKSKKIIETRLKNLGVEDYDISMDYQTGTISVNIPENSETDNVISNVLEVGKLTLKDSEDTSNVFLTNDNLKKASAVYNTTSSGTTVYLQLEFDKNGKNKLAELSTGDYATAENTTSDSNTTEDNSTEDESNENAVEAEAEASTEENTESEESTETTEDTESSDSESSDSTTQKKVILSIDDNDLITTSFDDPMEDGIIDLSMGAASSDQDTISDTLKSTSTVAVVLNSGEMPLTYKATKNQYVQVESKNVEKTAYIVLAVIVIVAVIILIIKYRIRGILAGVSYIGFVALDLILIRYTNVEISVSSFVAGVLVLILNLIMTMEIVKIKDADKEIEKAKCKESLINTIIKLVPLFIISVIFTFIKWTGIASFGMFVFWGILLSIVYNYIITRDIVD